MGKTGGKPPLENLSFKINLLKPLLQSAIAKQGVDH